MEESPRCSQSRSLRKRRRQTSGSHLKNAAMSSESRERRGSNSYRNPFERETLRVSGERRRQNWRLKRPETDTETLDRSPTFPRRKTRGCSAGLLKARNALNREQRKLARKKRKEESKKVRTVSSDKGSVCDSDEVIAQQLQDNEERTHMLQAQLSVVKEDADDVASRWADATPDEEDPAEKPDQNSPDHIAPMPPLKAAKNPFLLRDKHLTRSNLNKVLG